MLEILALLPVLAAPHGDGPQKPPAGPAGLFPASSYAVVEFAGLEACRSAAAGIDVWGFADQLAEKVAGRSAAELVRNEVLPEVRRGLAQAGFRPEELAQLLGGRVALGVGRVSFFDDEPMPSFALAIDASGGRAELAERAMLVFRRLMESEAPDPVTERREISGFAIDVVRSGSHNGAIGTARVGDWAVLASSPDYLAAICRTVAGAQPSMAQVAELGAARQERGEGALLDLFVNVGPFWDALGLALPYEADPILGALGVQRLDGLYAAFGVGEGRGQDRIHAAVTHDENGLVAALLPRGGASTRLASFCPPDVLWMSSMGLQPRDVHAGFERLLESLPNEARREVHREVFVELARELEREGFDPVYLTELLEKVGPSISFAVSMPRIQVGVPQIPTGYALIECEEPSQVAGLLVILLEKTGVEVKTVGFEGTQIHYFRVPEAGVPLAPALMPIEGGVLISTDLRSLKTAFRRSADAADPSLADDAEFQAFATARQAASGFDLLRLQRNVAAAYEAFKPLLEGWVEREGGPEFGLEVDDLPTGAELEGMLSDVVVALSRDERGVTLEVESPITLGSALAVVGDLADRVLRGEQREQKNN